MVLKQVYLVKYIVWEFFKAWIFQNHLFMDSTQVPLFAGVNRISSEWLMVSDSIYWSYAYKQLKAENKLVPV